MKPRIDILKAKKLVGMHMAMSFSNDRTGELWKGFMPRRSEVKHRSSTEFISMQIYPDNWDFSPDTLFEKWAAVEVSSFSDLPHHMDTYSLEGGLYAVFVHQGPAHEAARTMHSIFGQWLPQSEYSLDNREYFEILPENYSPVDPDASEEIWIPVVKTAK